MEAFKYHVQPGRYRHFKGNEYEVLGMARHSETEEEMVVYRALYGERWLWVRHAAMWCETEVQASGSAGCQRFRRQRQDRSAGRAAAGAQEPRAEGGRDPRG